MTCNMGLVRCLAPLRTREHIYVEAGGANMGSRPHRNWFDSFCFPVGMNGAREKLHTHFAPGSVSVRKPVAWYPPQALASARKLLMICLEVSGVPCISM